VPALLVPEVARSRLFDLGGGLLILEGKRLFAEQVRKFRRGVQAGVDC